MAGPAQLLSLIVARVVDPFRRDGSSWMAVAGVLVLASLALLAAYRQWGGVVRDDPSYQLTAQSIEVSPTQPTWIYGNVKAEVIRDGGFQSLSNLDRTLTSRMIDAFELHPWVERVESLRKMHPNGVRVRLAYRRPVAMVEVFDGSQRWISPVDRHGYVLPTDGFANQLDKPENYLRIRLDQQLTPGVAGTLWADVRIRDAAAVAAYLHDLHPKLGLYRVVALPASDQFRAPQFALATREQLVVVWGSAPGREEGEESSAEEKLVRLAAYVAENGPLTDSPENQVIDMRGPDGLQLIPRNARSGAGIKR